MLRTTIRGDTKAAIRRLEKLSRQDVPRAMTRAVNKTAFEMRDGLKQEIVRVFDRPIPFTKNSLYVKTAKGSDTKASVGIKDFGVKGTPAAKYLAPQIEGGGRAHKRFEKALIRSGLMPSSRYAIPANDAPLNAYGNIRPALYVQMLSALQANPDPLSNQTLRTARRNRRRGGYRFFMVRKNRQPIGIARARGRGGMQMLFFFGRQPRYSKRFDFYGVGDRIAAREFPLKVEREVQRALGLALGSR